MQNHSYFQPHHILPPQTINASSPSGSWTYGHSDIVLVNTDNGKVWPHSSLEGCICVSSVYLIVSLNFDSGHHIMQLQLIFHAVPSRRAPSAPSMDLILIYAQRFDILPQLNPTVQVPSTQKGLYPDLLHFYPTLLSLHLFSIMITQSPYFKDIWLYTPHHCDSFSFLSLTHSFFIYDSITIIRPDSYVSDSASRYVNQ